MPKSSRTGKSGSTVRTTSDVLDILEQNTKSISLSDTRKQIRKITQNDTSLASQTIKEIQSPLAIFQSISSVPDKMVQLMSRTGAILGGLQATSYFYPICNITDAPWDIFCSSIYGDPATLMGEILVITGADLVESMESIGGDNRVCIYRRSVNGSEEPITIRLFISTKHPIASVMDLRTTQQHSFISCVGAVCLWPDLLKAKKKKTKKFQSNDGLDIYPVGETKYRNRHSKMYPLETSLVSSIKIYSGLSDAEYVMFDNEASIPSDKFRLLSAELRDMVYAVSNTSTRYLGSINGM